MDTKFSPVFPTPPPPKVGKSPRNYMKGGLAILGFAALYHVVHRFAFDRKPLILTSLPVEVNVDATPKEDSWDWAAVEPNRELEWHQCYNGNFTCARLDVSLS